MHDEWFYLRGRTRALFANLHAWAVPRNLQFDAVRTGDIHAALKRERERMAGIPRGARFSSWEQVAALIPTSPPLFHKTAHEDDRWFALQRLQGPNVFALNRVRGPGDKFTGLDWTRLSREVPIDDQTWSKLAPGTLASAIQSKRLFAVDYSYQVSTPGGAFEGLSRPGLPGIVGLFYAGVEGLTPIAIGLTRKPAGRAEVVTPGQSGWRVAKHLLQVADFVDHQARVHLGRVHIPLWKLLKTLQRAHAEDGPMGTFLQPFLYAVDLNMEVGTHTLLGRGGLAETILQADHVSIDRFSSRGRASWDISQLDPIVEMELRGVGDDELHDDEFPYRSHARFLWSAFRRYVADLMGIWYPHDAALAADPTWRRWSRELGRRLDGGWKRNDLSRRSAIGLVAGMAFLSSVTHSAVNYPQADLCQIFHHYPPAAYPSAGTGDPLLDLLPPIRAAINQMTVMEVLAWRKFQTLDQLKALPGERTEAAHKKFQVDLDVAERLIRDQIARGVHLYRYLAPSEVAVAANV